MLIPSWSGELFAGRKDKYEGLVTTSLGNILQIPLKSSITDWNGSLNLLYTGAFATLFPSFPFVRVARGFQRELFHTLPYAFVVTHLFFVVLAFPSRFTCRESPGYSKPR